MVIRMRFYFKKFEIRSGPLALLAVGLQAIAIFAPLGFDDVPKRLLFELSYIFLLFFILLNLTRLGFVLIGIGLLLNFAAVVGNGGLMPVTAENLARIDQEHRLEGLEPGDAIPNTKNVWKLREDIHLYPLTDRILWDNPVVFRLFSLGDIVVAVGLAILLGELFLPRVRRSPEAGSQGTRRAPSHGARPS